MAKDLPTSPARVKADRPHVDPIEWLHRGNDGWIPFASIDGAGKFHHLYSAQANSLPTLFDSLADDLEVNSYFGIHSMLHPGPKKNPHHPTLPRALRKAEKVKYLTCCFSDLDFYKHGIELHEAVATVIYLQSRGLIPPASMFSDSGRGLWVYWLLHDREDAAQPPRAWPSSKVIWVKAQRELYRRLVELGSDKQALDMARVTRVPGSLNPKVNKRVAYWVQLDSTGNPFMYSLADLAGFLDLAPDPPTPLELEELGLVKKQKALAPGEKPRPAVAAWDGTEKTTWGDRKGGVLTVPARKGWAGRWVHALHDFDALRGMRGAFSRGCRNFSAYLYAGFLYKHRLPEVEVAHRVNELGKECQPPLSAAQVGNALRQGKRLSKIHNAEIADKLGITPEEAAFLTKWPPAGTPRPELRPKKRNEARAVRHALIERLLADSGGTPPRLRELQAILQNEGIDATLDTLQRDLAALGVKNPRRRRKATDQSSLF